MTTSTNTYPLVIKGTTFNVANHPAPADSFVGKVYTANGLKKMQLPKLVSLYETYTGETLVEDMRDNKDVIAGAYLARFEAVRNSQASLFNAIAAFAGEYGISFEQAVEQQKVPEDLVNGTSGKLAEYSFWADGLLESAQMVRMENLKYRAMDGGEQDALAYESAMLEAAAAVGPVEESVIVEQPEPEPEPEPEPVQDVQPVPKVEKKLAEVWTEKRYREDMFRQALQMGVISSEATTLKGVTGESMRRFTCDEILEMHDLHAAGNSPKKVRDIFAKRGKAVSAKRMRDILTGKAYRWVFDEQDEEQEDVNDGGSMGERVFSPNDRLDVFYVSPNDDETSLETGWYYGYKSDRGALLNGDPNGPFETEDEAREAAALDEQNYS